MVLRIRVLFENYKGVGVDKLLKVWSGLSLLVEDEFMFILFDIGFDGSFM